MIAFVRCILPGDINKILTFLLPGVSLLIQRVSHNIDTFLLGKNIHPVTVATFGDQLCHLEPKAIVES